MVYTALADLVVIVHFLFIVFVVAGALLVLRWPLLAWVHVPAAIWGAAIEFGGWICPLTPLEQQLRQRAGAGTYDTSFVEQYLLPVIYPAGLTRDVQLVLGTVVVAVNAGIYCYLLRRAVKRKQLHS